jgi:hypothetical protein
VSDQEYDLRSAADFRLARLRNLLGRVLSVFSGAPRRLLAFDEVREKLHVGGPIYRGVQSVPVARILGSVDRYRDFDGHFLPQRNQLEQRWTRVNRAWYQEISLPPVLLYQVGDVYFVVDGNHRVSVARAQGQEFIDAEVRQCSSRVPLTPEIRPEDLERLGDKVEFLERTRLDRIRPEAVVEPTILGGYDRILEHIAVHRYFMGMDEQREVPEEEAVAHWYDTLFKPTVEVIDESGVLADFPGRTATDLYLWVMDHLHYLRSQPGGESLDAHDAAESYLRYHEDKGHARDEQDH